MTQQEALERSEGHWAATGGEMNGSLNLSEQKGLLA